MTPTLDDVGSAATRIGEWFDRVFADLGELSHNNELLLDELRGRKGLVTDKILRALRVNAERFLSRHEVPEAAGITLAPGVLGLDQGAVEWWSKRPSGSIDRVPFTLDSNSPAFYDILGFPWFSEVLATGKPTVQGPYLDYAGMDQYILTLMVPFRVDTVLVGTAGCDIEVRSLESVIIPVLREVPGDAALVSRSGRVIAGNSGRFLVGNRVTDIPSGGVRTPVPGNAVGLDVIAAPARF